MMKKKINESFRPIAQFQAHKEADTAWIDCYVNDLIDTCIWTEKSLNNSPYLKKIQDVIETLVNRLKAQEKIENIYSS